VGATWPASGHASERTFDVAAVARPLPGSLLAASHPSLSANGRVIAFDSPLAFAQPVLPSGYVLGPGALREVYAVNLVSRVRTLISVTAAGLPALGSSSAPSVSADGATVAFVSNATDLAPGVGQVHDDVYVHLPNGQVELVSAAVHGGAGDAASDQPVISGDGRFVAFTSEATDLVAPGLGAPTSRSEVYLRDLRTGRTTLVSAAPGGSPANSWASNPSISRDGRYVTFDSAATNLPGSPRGGAPQVYVADLARHQISLVSVTSGGVRQNQAVGPPFRQISSISADGRFVAFDSDATNLVRFDENRRTDVFIRDRLRRRTVLVSVSNTGFEGNSDSFAPTLSADGKKVAFESFASNLDRGGGPRENVFVRDLAVGATSVIDVLPDGSPPGRERAGELLQRPVLSGNGAFAGFESTAQSLTKSATPEAHVFVRIMSPATARFVQAPPAVSRSRTVTATVTVNDPAATMGLCQVDTSPRFPCAPGKIHFRNLPRWRHTLSIWAGGPGLLYQPVALRAMVTIRG
jgi:Tol biopolymer transport system component